MSEKVPRLKPHERLRGVNPYVREYGGRLTIELANGDFLERLDTPELGWKQVKAPSEQLEIPDNIELGDE